MKMKKIISIFLLLIVSSVGYSQTDTLSLRKRIAVLDLSDKSGWKDGNAGLALTTMLITELSKTNKFQLIEKEMLQGVTDPTTGELNIQRLNQQGVQLVVTGGITEYGSNTTTKGEYYVYFSQKKSKQLARVAVDLRLINTSSGEIILAEKAVAEESSESKSSGIGAYGLYGGTTQDNTLLDITVLPLTV